MVYADSLPASPSGGPLTSAQIAQAVLGSEAPSSLYLSHLNISEIPDNAVQQLAQLRSVDDNENDGTILRSVTSRQAPQRPAIHSHAYLGSRIALSNNHLRTLPASFNLLWRLRYLNLRSNALHQFPEVVRLSFSVIVSFTGNPPFGGFTVTRFRIAAAH
jgi:Leucine-rich repeat (LRR) protein